MKKYKIIWSPKAFNDLDNIYNYIKYYLKRDRKAFEIAKKKKVLARALQVEIPDQIFEELEKFVNE